MQLLLVEEDLEEVVGFFCSLGFHLLAIVVRTYILIKFVCILVVVVNRYQGWRILDL